MLWDFDIPSVFLDEDKINRNAAYMKSIFCAHLLEQPLQALLLYTNGGVSIIISSCYQKWLFKLGKILHGSEQHFCYKHATFNTFLWQNVFFYCKGKQAYKQRYMLMVLGIKFMETGNIVCVNVPKLRKIP